MATSRYNIDYYSYILPHSGMLGITTFFIHAKSCMIDVLKVLKDFPQNFQMIFLLIFLVNI